MVVIIYFSLLCIGAIDSFEIEIRQPLNRLAAYTSRKCKTTVKVQAVATWDLKFIDVKRNLKQSSMGNENQDSDWKISTLTEFKLSL